MMTLEEAIKNREDFLKYLEGIGRKSRPECAEAVRWSVKALKALRPVSREQVEKVFPGCPKCRYEDGKEPMDIYYPDGWDNGIGFEYGKAIFCPECGRPLTDEAVDIRLKELEALKDA